jgi:hypothetical protein
LASSLKLAEAVETIQAKGMTSQAHGDDKTIINQIRVPTSKLKINTNALPCHADPEE